MIWKITLPSNNSYFLSSAPSCYEELLDLVYSKYDVRNYGPFVLKYIDAEDEFINLSSSEDFDTAILSAKREKLHTLQIFVIPTVNNQPNKNYPKGRARIPSSSTSMDGAAFMPSSRKRLWTTYVVGKPSQITQKKPYQSKLPLINEAQILQKGQRILTNFGKIKRNSSCPAVVPSSWESGGFDISTKDLKSVCLKFLEKFAEEKINNKVKEEIKDIIPVLMDLLREAWRINGSKMQPVVQPGQKPQKICSQCKLPTQDVRYICLGCIRSNNFVSKINMSAGARLPSSLGSNKVAQHARDAYQAKRMNSGTFTNHLALKRTKSRKEAENYKVAILRVKPDDVQEVNPYESYKVKFELKNCGEVKWPENVRLVCINGLNKGHEKMLPSLEPGRKTTMELTLQAPKEEGKYLSQWRLSYGKGKKQRSFGESLFEEIQVTSEKVSTNSENEQAKDELSLKRDRGRQEQGEGETSERKQSDTSNDSWTSKISDNNDNHIPSKINCAEDRMKCAKFLNEVFPGDLKEKIEFIKKFLEEVTIFDVVEKYLVTLGKSKLQDGQKDEVIH